MKYRRGGPFKGKSGADKLKAALGTMPSATRLEVRDALVRDLEELVPASEGGVAMNPADRRDLGEVVTGLALVQRVLSLLEGAPGTGQLSAAIEQSHDHYMPGGPPMSPVHDSLWVAWSNLDLRVGRHRESAADVAMAVLPVFGLGHDLIASVRRSMDTRLGIYQVMDRLEPLVGDGLRYRLRELVTRREIDLQMLEDYDPVPFTSLVLLRAIEATPRQARARQVTHLSLGNHYVIEHTTVPEWVDYFEREAARVRKSRLTPEVYEAIMRGEGESTRWLDYVVDGYMGSEHHNVVHLQGYPDRPETLPHHLDHDPVAAEKLPSRASNRERSSTLSRRLSSRFGDLLRPVAEAAQALERRLEGAVEAAGGRYEHWRPLVYPVLLYGAGPDGRAPLVRHAARSVEVDEDLQEWIDESRGHRLSVYEAVEVVEGVRATLRDIFDGRVFEVEERSGTAAMPPGVLLLALLMPYRGEWTIEGLYARPAPPSARAALVDQLEPLRRREGGLDPAQLEALVRAWQRIEGVEHERVARMLTGALRTSSGEALRPTRLRYALGHNPRDEVLDAVLRLRGCAPMNPDGAGLESESGEWIDAFVIIVRGTTIEARILLGDRLLEIEAMAPERARRVHARIRSKLSHPLVALERRVTDLASLLPKA